MTPGAYNLPPMRRGDSVPECAICTLTRTDTGAAIGVAAARLQIRDKMDRVIHEWSTTAGTLTISGAGNNVVTRLFTPGATTAQWAAGRHTYDLELTTLAGDTWTVLAGIADVAGDVTR